MWPTLDLNRSTSLRRVQKEEDEEHEGVRM